MLKSKSFLLPIVLLVCGGTPGLGVAQAQTNAEQIEFFETRIRPLLSSKCFACHGTEMQMAKLNLSTAADFFKGGESGPVVVKGEPENSRIISAVNYQGQIKMPPTGKLKDAEIADLVAAWAQSKLQWCRDPETSERSCTSSATWRTSSALQWCRDPETSERGGGDRSQEQRDVASMVPRS